MKPFIGAMGVGLVFGLFAYLMPGLTGFFVIPLP